MAASGATDFQARSAEEQDCDLEEALRNESVGLGFAGRATNDAKESRLAFQEKRKGVYTGT